MPGGMRVTIMRDATQERAHTEELEEARRTRKLLGASAGIGIWSYDPVKDRTWWSDEIVSMIGLDPEKVGSADAFTRLLPQKDRAGFRDAMQRAIVSGETPQFEHKVWARDRWMTVRVTVHTEPTERGVYMLKGISEDITELPKRATPPAWASARCAMPAPRPRPTPRG